MNKVILIEGQEFSLDGFIKANTGDGVEELSDNEINELNSLRVNEVMYLAVHAGWLEVKRIK